MKLPECAPAIQHEPPSFLEFGLSAGWFRKRIGEHKMPLVTLVITLAVVGVLLWLVNLIPMQGTVKGLLNLVVVIAVVIWLLKVFNLLGYITQFHVGH